MNDWNPLELQKWNPRPPSPELRARIFGAEAQTTASGGAVTFSLGDITRWIVPAFGCFLLVMASLSNHIHMRFAVQLADTNFALPSLMDEHAGQLPPESSTKHSVMNNIPARTLEWNYRPRSAATSMGTILISYTNKLIQ